MKKFAALTLTMALVTSSAAASAATTITYTGTVGSVAATGDSSIYFGVTPLTVGTAYALVYTINDGAAGTVSNPDAWSVKRTGLGTMTAVLTINGMSQTIESLSQGELILWDGRPNVNGDPTDLHSALAHDYYYVGNTYRDHSAASYISSYQSDFIHGLDYHQSFSHAPDGADSYYNYVYFNDADFAPGGQSSSIYLNLSPGRAPVVVTTGAVPEPASWALMIGGFALAGAAMRRRVAVGAVRFA